MFWFLLREGKHPEENEEEEDGRKVLENHLKLMKLRMINQFTWQAYFEAARVSGQEEGQGKMNDT